LAQQDYDSTTFRGGGYLGYNWQLDPNWVVGLEGDFAWGSASTRVDRLQGLPPAPLVNVGNISEFKQTWDGGIRGRVGYLLAPTRLVYATGGVQWQHVEATVNCAPATCTITPFSQSNDETLTRWTGGGGIETLLWDNWLARLEYRYADYGTWRTVFGPAGGADREGFCRHHAHGLGGLWPQVLGRASLRLPPLEAGPSPGVFNL